MDPNHTAVRFERYVNSKDNQTDDIPLPVPLEFERYVNSKDNQTAASLSRVDSRLRDM